MDILSELTEALRCLPGVGPKSAQRMVFYLLHQHRKQGLHLAGCLHEAMQAVKQCERCNNYTVHTLCQICSDPTREANLLCVVENPADLSAIEQSQAFKGCYYVLMGKISPINGMGPEQIGLPRLEQLIATQQIAEVLLALSPTVEGQTTIHFIRSYLQPYAVRISELAYGIPFGCELEFLDGHTIKNAIANRASNQFASDKVQDS